jgi:hypothetical protein
MFHYDKPEVSLTALLHLMSLGKLKSHIGEEAPWTEVSRLANDLLNRKFLGKAVLYLPS